MSLGRFTHIALLGPSLYLAAIAEPEGLVQYPQSLAPVSEPAAVATWFEDHVAKQSLSWKPVIRMTDDSFTHGTYDLYYAGRRILDGRVKLHYDRRGWIDSSSGALQKISGIPDAFSGEQQRQQARNRVILEFRQKYGRSPARLDSEAVVWRSDDGAKIRAAVQFTLVDTPTGKIGRWVVDEQTGKTLSEIPSIRYAKAFRKYPSGDGTGGTGLDYTDVTLTGLLSPTVLQSGRIWVQRDQKASALSSVFNATNIDPTQDFSAITTLPSTYNSNCIDAGGATGNSCPNQEFDGVNIYYHLESYREAVDSYYRQMGVSPDLLNDSALRVFVNFRSADLDGDGVSGDEANNAAYISTPCRSDISVERCLVFLPPAAATTSSCGRSGAITFFSLAREATVAVHEYQHYITDRVTGMLPSSSYNVGDALHEGYSDYFAVSHISSTANEAVTNVGAYAFQNCTPVQRDISSLQAYENTEDDQDPHYAGKSWSSGLYELRRQYGKSVADQIAYRSQFFLPTKPGFQDAVESLIKADQVLFDGAHSDEIRSLYYDRLTFLGGKSGVFRDSARGIAEVGFQSCGSVGASSRLISPSATWITFFGWLVSTLAFARWRRRR